MPLSEADLRAMLDERSRKVPLGTDLPAVARRRGRRILAARRGAGAALVACAVAAIALVPFGRVPAPPEPAAGGSGHVDVSLFRGRLTSDVLAETPAELARRSDAVVVGTYDGITLSRSVRYQRDAVGPPTLASLELMVIRVRVDRTIKGAGKYVHGGRIAISFCCSSRSAQAGDYRTAIPRGSRLIAFLYARPAAEIGPQRWLTPDDRPAGAALMEPHPQGLIFEEAAPGGATRLVGGIVDLPRQCPCWNRFTTLDSFAEQLGP